jgi:hypothetical protein
MDTYIIYSNTPDMVLRSDGANIPIGEQFAGRFDNPDYQRYMKWLEEGNKPEYVERVTDKWKAVRSERARLLSACDWTQLPDALNEEKRKEWAEYRQALRNMPQEFEKAEDVVFPIPPK